MRADHALGNINDVEAIGPHARGRLPQALAHCELDGVFGEAHGGGEGSPGIKRSAGQGTLTDKVLDRPVPRLYTDRRIRRPSMPKWLRKRRRRRLVEQPFPAEWNTILRGLPILARLPEGDHDTLRKHIRILLEEKTFEGCGGLEITDEIRVTVAAYSAVLILHRETDYYPQLASILIYPDAYGAPGERHVGEYLVEEGTEVREGESWYRGSMVLSWRDVRRGVHNAKGGDNVVFHEFAHQLDDESGTGDGTPVMETRQQWRRWVRVCEAEYQSLVDADERGRKTLIDPYGAESPSEFFAVVTECFFNRPQKLEKRHPELYEVFAAYYKQDPGRWTDRR